MGSTVGRLVAFVAVSLGGCAIRPEPANYSRVSTFQIVKQIRCETRSAAISLALDYAKANKDNRSIAERFDGMSPAKITLDPTIFVGDVRKNIELFWKSGVAYNFNLEMTEVNNLDSEFNFLRTLTYRTVNLGVKAGLDRQRQNIRSFTVTDRIDDLVKEMGGPDGCEARAVGPNYVYPIAGHIGVKGLLKSFVWMTLFNNLSGFQDKIEPTKLGGPPTMVDALEFETTVYGDATPKISFSPVGDDGLDLMNASLGSTNSRKDKHRVVMGIALTGVSDDELRQIRKPYVGRFVTTNARTGAEIAAATAVDQVITENALSRITLIER